MKVMVCCVFNALHWNSTKACNICCPQSPFYFSTIKLQSLSLSHTVKALLSSFFMVVCYMFLLVKTYLFLTLNHFTVLQTFIGMASGLHWHMLCGEVVWASVACGAWLGVSGSGHGLWLLDLSLMAMVRMMK